MEENIWRLYLIAILIQEICYMLNKWTIIKYLLFDCYDYDLKYEVSIARDCEGREKVSPYK